MKSEQLDKLYRRSSIGSYDIEVLGNIIRFDGRGSVSEESVKQYHKDIIELSADMHGGWALLALVAGAGLLTPAAEKALVGSILHRKQLGMMGCAIVVEKADIPILVRSQFERIYYESDLAFQFCSNEEEALNWLETIGCYTGD